jgi:hypothetical protein
MKLRTELENLIDEMLDGKILLPEAVAEFERVYIEKALTRSGKRLSATASAIGLHRNTLSKKVAAYETAEPQQKPLRKKRFPRNGNGNGNGKSILKAAKQPTKSKGKAAIKPR